MSRVLTEAQAVELLHQMRNKPEEPAQPETESKQPNEVAQDAEELQQTTEPSQESGTILAEGQNSISEVEETDETRGEEADQEAGEIRLEADQLADLLGIKPDDIIISDDGKIKFRTSVDGATSDATLAEIKKSYQLDAHLTNRGKELSEQRKKVDAEYGTILERAQAMAHQVDAFYKQMEDEILAPYQQLNWDTLRSSDPAEYAARKQEMRDISERLVNRRENAMKEIAHTYEQAKEYANQKMTAYIESQRNLLQDYVPGWNDEMRNNISNFLTSEGFTSDEIKAISDARVIKLAAWAMAYSKGKNEIPKKLNKPLPKVIKPGAKQSPDLSKSALLKKAQENLKKSGTVNDAVALLRARRK